MKIVLYRKEGREKNIDIVLAAFKGLFVTWAYNNEDRNFYHGNFFDNYEAAKEDYKGRML